MKKYFMAKMSSGKRLAKRSIVGMRVCALHEDGYYYPCRIASVKSPNDPCGNQNCINITPTTRFSVRFDPNARLTAHRRSKCDFMQSELIGEGFSSILEVKLKSEQRVYLTHNGREISGTVINHDVMMEEVTILCQTSPSETPFELVKKLEEVRLAESRRSPRLADQERDTDFARLADMGGDRRRSSSYSIDVPLQLTPTGSARKRRISYSQEDLFGVADLGDMSECNAALVLMSLSHSPNSSIQGYHFSGSVQSYSGSSSPPLSDDGNVSSSSTSSEQKYITKSNHKQVNQHMVIVNNIRRGQRTTSLSTSDEGIVMDYVAEEMPRKRRSKIFKCTWKNCGLTFGTDQQVKSHVRNAHLGPKSTDDEDFYYTDLEDEDEAIVLEASNTSPPLPPTLSHSDMARPPHEDPEYQRKIVGNMRQGLLMSTNNGQTFVKVPMSSPMVLPHNSNYTWSPLPSQNSPHKASRPSTSFAPYISPTYSTANYPVLVQQYHSMPSQGSIAKLSHSSPPQLPPPPQQNSMHHSSPKLSGGGKIRPNISSPGRRTRGENKKCRKVYGMDNRELWCTQCKWKKACSRFGE